VASGAARPPSDAAIRDQLARILSSTHFLHAQSLSQLLRFVVDQTLQGHEAQLKEARLGLEVLNRSAQSYDSTIDPIVRVQMGRLRARLRTYYASEGARDRVLIEVPKGSYVPVFKFAATDTATAGSTVDRPTASTPRLAVLPFVNMTPETENEYFSDGLTEELINLLARDRRLQVVARTSSFQFKGVARDIRDIARQL
jgi:adenylate cyclase